jgi:hypothetical protein
MHRLRALVVALIALTLSLTGLSTASANTSNPRAPEISFLAPVAWATQHKPDTVQVVGTYRCWGPSTSMHLWVSVKQGGPDPTAEGSSSTVKAWYDTNISQDVAVRCNGHWQTTVVDLGRHPTDFSGRPLGYLKNGRAWLQFCLVSMADENLLASKSRWVSVVGARH